VEYYAPRTREGARPFERKARGARRDLLRNDNTIDGVLLEVRISKHKSIKVI